MGLRPAKCYKWDSPAYTRISNNPSDSFITGVPGPKITHYETGNLSREFDTEVSIVSNDQIQIRHNSLEASRVTANKILEGVIGTSNYRFKVRVFPHHVMRENAMATGAGADRASKGMAKPFGRPIGTAARIKKGQAVFSIYINKSEDSINIAKKALHTAIMKLPGSMKITVRRLSVGN